MDERLSLALAAGALMAAMLPGVVAARAEAEEVSLLFVVSSTSGSVAGDTRTLDAVPAVV